MTKHEFMTQLAAELHKRNIADAADVLEEYEQHFALSSPMATLRRRSPPGSAAPQSWPRSLTPRRRGQSAAPPR